MKKREQKEWKREKIWYMAAYHMPTTSIEIQAKSCKMGTLMQKIKN